MVAQQLVAPAQEKPLAWRDVYQIVGLMNGYADWGAEVTLTSLNSATAYSQTIRNLGIGGHLLVQRSTDGATVLSVTDTGLAVSALTVDTLTVNHNATVGGTLGVTGTSTFGVVNAAATTVTTLHATSTATLDGAVTVNNTLHTTGAVDFDSTANVDGVATVNSLIVTTTAGIGTDLGVVGNLTVNGNTALGNANADTVTVIATTTVKNVGSTAVQLHADPANNRVIVGTSTALGSDTTPNLQVVGRLYVAPESANDLAVQIRRSSAGTTGWNIGVTSTSDLVFKDLTTVETVRVGAVASTYQIVVTGASHFTGTPLFDANIDVQAGVAGQIRVGAVIANAASLSSTEKLRVGGSSLLEGAVTVTTGGLTVTAGGLTVTAGGLTVSAGGASITGTTTLVQAEVLSGVISATLTANTDNWTPTGLATARVIRIGSTGGPWNLTGITAPSGPVGQVLTLRNVSGVNVVLIYDATSTAANRFVLANGVNLTIRPQGAATVWYDVTTARWAVTDSA